MTFLQAELRELSETGAGALWLPSVHAWMRTIVVGHCLEGV